MALGWEQLLQDPGIVPRARLFLDGVWRSLGSNMGKIAPFCRFAWGEEDLGPGLFVTMS